MRKWILFLVPVILSLVSSNAHSQWPLNGAALGVAANDQVFPTIASDGAGGAIVTWYDSRGPNFDIYAQRVAASGLPQWTPNGVAICTAANNQFNPTIVPDGAGGAIITWQDNRSGTADVYAQRINAAGVVQWAANGVVLCNAVNDQYTPAIASDGAGGAIVTWYDTRGANADIYAQRVNSVGAVQWTPNGVAVCTAAGDQYTPVILGDGAGGCILSWHELRFAVNGFDVYAQRLNATGVAQWTANGVALCSAPNDQFNPRLAPDGSGGVIAAWVDLRNVTNFDVYAQHVSVSGAVQWTVDGVPICTQADNQEAVGIAADGAGGAIVCWEDTRSAQDDIYAQHVIANGIVQWQADGFPLCMSAGLQKDPVMISDGVGGAVVTWSDGSSGIGFDIYAIRVSIDGVYQWSVNGVPICTAARDQEAPAIVADGAGGVIIAWHDFRSSNTDVYAQRAELDFGTAGRPEPFVVSATDVPKDQGGKVAVNWDASGYDIRTLFTISHYSIWRAVDPAAAAQAASRAGAWTDLSSVGPDFRGPAWLHEREGSTDYYWEWVANQDALHDKGYSYAVPTREDSVAGNSAVHYFRVVAHTSDPYIVYKSNTISGHSVDNLAPAAPLLLTAQRAGADVQLKWNRAVAPDLRDYSLYRATSSGVTPVPVNFLESSNDTLAVDANAPTSALYYIVTAYDVHANQSAPSNEASVNALTNVGNTPALTALTVMQNHPNPFNATTDFEIGLPTDGDVSIEVFDVAGRSVSAINTKGIKGWQRIPFAARDERGKPLASGVYFYRVHAAGSTITRKMVIAR